MRCALIPFVGSSREPVGFFDFGTETFGGDHVYVSWTAFLEMAESAGFVPANDRVQTERLARLEARVQTERERAEVAEAQLAAVEVLKAGGFTSARKPGRPKKQAKEAVA